MSSLGPRLLVSRQACPYLEGETETLLHVSYPESEERTDHFESDLFDRFWLDFAKFGYRRQGRHIYRPRCETCNACIPTRVLVDEFEWKRRYKRILRKNQDIEIQCSEGYEFTEREIFQLYSKYLESRHQNGPMFPPNIETMRSILYLENDRTDFHIVGKLDGKLVFLAQTDNLLDGLSANYTIFDPDFADRSLGIFAILTQIRCAMKLSLPYVYLGFSLNAIQNMKYKSEFHPQEQFVDDTWQLVQQSTE